MVRNRKDNLTLNLLDWQPPQVAVSFEPTQVRANNLGAKFARAISLTMTECSKDRETIAAEMSDYLGEKVSKDMLYAYSSEARESHSINLPRFAALIHATEDYRLLSLIPEMFGFAVVDDKYQDIIELHLIEEHERKVSARKATLQMRRKTAP